MVYSKPLLVLAIWLAISGCQSKTKPQETVVASEPDFTMAQETKIIASQTPDGLSYLVRKPSKNQQPTITVFFFDPNGDASKVLAKYESLADEFGWMLIASAAHKNGIGGAEGWKYWASIQQSATKTFGLDTTHFIAAGFSGGARQAAALLASGASFKGLIGNSAGFPLVPEILRRKFNFYGLYGDADMNLLEMENLKIALKSTQVNFQMERFQGFHNWAPTQQMKNAFYWMAATNGFESIPENLSKQCPKSHEADSTLFRETYNKSRLALRGKPCQTCDASISAYLQNQENQKRIEAKADWISTEEKCINEIRNCMGQLDMNSWQIKIKKWATDSSGNSEKALCMKRILSYLSLLCYTAGNQELLKGNGSAGYFAQLYVLCDPSNHEAWTMLARYYARISKNDLANQAVEKALERGSNPAQLKTYPELAQLSGW